MDQQRSQNFAQNENIPKEVGSHSEDVYTMYVCKNSQAAHCPEVLYVCVYRERSSPFWESLLRILTVHLYLFRRNLPVTPRKF